MTQTREQKQASDTRRYKRYKHKDTLFTDPRKNLISILLTSGKETSIDDRIKRYKERYG